VHYLLTRIIASTDIVSQLQSHAGAREDTPWVCTRAIVTVRARARVAGKRENASSLAWY
jgi:hypothetical protein